jgi:hypothetical protein
MEESRKDPTHKGSEAIIGSFPHFASPAKNKKGRSPMQPAFQ